MTSEYMRTPTPEMLDRLEAEQNKQMASFVGLDPEGELPSRSELLELVTEELDERNERD